MSLRNPASWRVIEITMVFFPTLRSESSVRGPLTVMGGAIALSFRV